MQLEIPSCLGYSPESLNVYGFDAQTKINAFYQLALPSKNLVCHGIYLKSWFSFLGGGV